MIGVSVSVSQCFKLIGTFKASAALGQGLAHTSGALRGVKLTFPGSE